MTSADERIAKLEDEVRDLKQLVASLVSGGETGMSVQSRVYDSTGSGSFSDLIELGTQAVDASREHRAMLAPDKAKCIDSKGQTGGLGLKKGNNGLFVSVYDSYVP
ncbi:MAG: hypothetical protein GHCLOJNM_01562 [bacterium]|nr:hypothetical protein [bacterium]